MTRLGCTPPEKVDRAGFIIQVPKGCPKHVAAIMSAAGSRPRMVKRCGQDRKKRKESGVDQGLIYTFNTLVELHYTGNVDGDL